MGPQIWKPLTVRVGLLLVRRMLACFGFTPFSHAWKVEGRRPLDEWKEKRSATKVVAIRGFRLKRAHAHFL